MEARETDQSPICPHCELELDVVLVNAKVKVRGLLGAKYGQAYSCPHCRKVLGFADWAT